MLGNKTQILYDEHQLASLGYHLTDKSRIPEGMVILGIVCSSETDHDYAVWVDSRLEPTQLAHISFNRREGKQHHFYANPWNYSWVSWFRAGLDELHRAWRGKGPMADSERLALLGGWDLLEAVIAAGSPRILTFGPPGLGKSYTPAKIARDKGWEFLSITLTDQTPMTELRGHFVLKGQEFVWHDGIIARAWRMTQAGKGVILELNEIIEAGSDVEVFLHNALDDPEFARLDLPTGETLRPVAGKIVVVATMNAEPEQLREALRDRFPVVIPALSVHPDAIKALPTDLRPLALKMTDAKKSDRLSIRPFVEFARLRAVMPVAVAAQAVFGAAAHDIVAALAMAKSAK